MAAKSIAVTEHLVLRPMASDDAPALAAYRSDPVQARYQSWETPLDEPVNGLDPEGVQPATAAPKPSTD
jgi:RimJ/RimL family protein N-acetyltransferase